MTQQNSMPEQKTALEQSAPNPYVGPRPFTTAEKDRFFGREQEANQLIPLIIAERLVLFYAQSGAGKSSLINARLVPGLTERNFKVLTGRVSGQSVEGAQADNIFTNNLLLSFERSEHGSNGNGAPDPHSLEKLTLADYLADMDIEPPAEPEAPLDGADLPAQKLLIDAPQTIGGVQPLALIIDQFEEIFTTNPGAWSQRAPFFQQISEAMEADPYLWVVLAIREDYIAALDPYADLLPGRLRARFYMQRMGYYAALDAVCSPVEKLRPFEDDATEELVKNLSLISTGKDKDNNPIYQPGQFIEPVQLQVVCYQLWEELRSHPGTKITRDDLFGLAKGRDLAQFISAALANYYVESIHEVLKLYSDIPERRLREWFSRELITETETRGAVRQGAECTGTPPNDLPNAVVKTLQDRFIIRAEIRGENTWYELSHDRFVRPVLQSNREWFDKNSRPVETAAQAWFDSKEDAARLYDGRQLQDALVLLHDHPDDLSEKAQKFIQASQATAEKREKRRQRALIAFFALLVVVLSGLTAFSFRQSQIAGQQSQLANQQSQLARTNEAAANEQKITADVASTQANLQRATAEEASVLEAQQRHRAETASAMEAGLRQAAEVARATVEAAKDTAEVASAQAVQERDAALRAELFAQAARLASLSDYFRENKLDLSLLLAIQAVKTSRGWQSQRVLLDGIQHGLENRVSPSGFPWYVKSKPYSVAFSPDGTQVVAGSIAHVDIWNVVGQGRAAQMPPGFEADFSMYSVAFDSTGTLLARGGGDGKVRIWNRTTGEIREYSPFPSYAFSSVLAVAFQPGGDLLAVATEKDPTTEKGLLYLYNYKKYQVESSWDCGSFSCETLAWSPDGGKLAVGSQGGALQVLDVAHKTSLMTVERAHSAEITGLAWYPDGQRLISGGVDQHLIQWDTVARKIVRQTSSKETPIVISLALSPDGRFLLAGVNDRSTWFGLWDAETLQKMDVRLSGHSQPVSAVAFNPQGNLFVTAGYDNAIVLWKFEPVETLGRQVFNLSGGRVESLFQGQDGTLRFARTTGSVSVETVSEGALKPATQQTLAHSTLEMATLDGRPVTVLGGSDGLVSFVEPASGKPVRNAIQATDGSIRSLAVSADGKLLAAASCLSSLSCSRVVLYDLAGDQPLALKSDLSLLKLGVITSLTFSPDDKTLAFGNSAGKIFFYDLATGKVDQAVTEGLSLQNVTLVVTSLAFSPDQNLLAAGFHDGRIALWEASSRGPIGEFVERANGEVSSLLFRKDPQDGLLSLVSASAQGEVREWVVDPQAWIARACQLAGRNLTAEEKAKFLIPGSSQSDVCPAQK